MNRLNITIEGRVTIATPQVGNSMEWKNSKIIFIKYKAAHSLHFTGMAKSIVITKTMN